VVNLPQSSDLYFDAEVSALIPIPTKKVVAKAGPFRPGPLPNDKLPSDLKIDKQTKTVSLPCTIAPRKLPHLKEVYPIEVVATHPHPQGQKAHETVVNFQGIKPSMVHRALMELGAKPGQPARGDGAKPSGPQVAVFVDLPEGGKTKRLPLEQVLIDTRTGKQPPSLVWHFTGSAARQPNPDKDVLVYGADESGTLITIFPVTDETVLQAGLGADSEQSWRLETNGKVLPKEGTPARLVLQVK
jgi:hypothetical protein